MKDLSIKDNVPPEISQAIRDTIGRKQMVILKKMVKLERSHNKIDSKVLILTPYRCQLLGIKQPFKLEADLHYFDIKSMDSPSPEKLKISTKSGKVYTLHMLGPDDADHIIGRVALALRTIFPNVTLTRILKATLIPSSRQKVIQTMLNQADESEPGPCGNFSEMYRCICDHMGVPVRDDVEWDIETIYLSQNCREMILSDFELNDARDIIPIISVLKYNRWFEGLTVQNMKLNSDTFEQILKVVKNSLNLKQLVLDNVFLKGDFAYRLATCLMENNESCLEVLDLSNNPVEDKGLLHISGALPLIKHGSVRKLIFSKSGLTAKGISGLCQSIRSSPTTLSSLTHLNLSDNLIKSDEAEGLYSFLSNKNQLTDLDLSGTDCSVDAYVSALSKGCLIHLQNVKLGRNHFHAKKRDSIVQPSFQQFFEQTTSLKSIDFSQMKFPPEALKCIMNGLFHNKTKGLQVEINLSSCDLKAVGCQVLQSTIASVTNISKLDVSDNSFDSDVIGLLAWIQKNKSLKELHVGRNFSGIKPKHMKRAAEALVGLIQEDDSCLESLSLVDSKIREYLFSFLSCLGSNTSLTSLDISGNLIGDAGSRVLAKSLQINSKLRILKFDRNSLSALGFHELASAMERNFTLRYVPYPVNDVVAAMKHYPERTQSALAQMQDLLLRNANANRATNDQQFRLQKVMTNTAQQVVDKLAVKVDDIIRSLEMINPAAADDDDVKKAKGLVKDANNSKQLLSDMYALAMEKTSGHTSSFQEKINQVADGMDDLAQKHFKANINAMMRNAESQCPHLYEEIRSDLESCVDQRCPFPPGCVRSDVIKTSGSDLVNKMSELNLTVAILLSNQVTDRLLDSLSHSNVALTEQLNKAKTQSQSKATPVKSAPSPELASKSESGEDSQQQNGGSDLPKMKRERAQSVAKRRQRPVTSAPVSQKSDDNRMSSPPDTRVTEEANLEAIKQEEDSTSNQEKKSEVASQEDDDYDDASIASGEILESDDDFLDGEPTEVLDHVTKARPRGPKRRKRKQKKPQVDVEETDVSNFFEKNVANTDFTKTLTHEDEEEVKRQERLKEKKAKTTSTVGFPMVNLAAMKPLKKVEAKDETEEKKQDDVNVSPQSSKPRPKTMMAVPGMGMGGDFMAEFKKKKMAKKGDEAKLPATPSDGKKSGNENNNNSSSPRPVPKSRLKPVSRGDDVSVAEKPDPLPKGKVPLLPTKPLFGKTPPPLPNKPKPVLRGGNENKFRPVSEFYPPAPPSVDKSRTSSLKDSAAK